MKETPPAPSVHASQGDALDRCSPQQIQAWIVSHMSALLDVPEAQMDASRTFEQYGLDSIAAVALLSDLGVWLGKDLDTSLIDRDATLASLSAQLAEVVRG